MLENNDQVKLDTTMSLTSLLQEVAAEPVEEEKQTMSPLEKMRQYNEANRGLVLGNDEYEEDGYRKPLKANYDTPERQEANNKALDDFDQKIKVAQNVKRLRPIRDQSEMVLIMDALSAVAENGGVPTPDIKASVKGLLEFTSDKSNDVIDVESTVSDNTKTEESHASFDRDNIIRILIDKNDNSEELKKLSFTDEEQKKIRNSKLIEYTEVEEKSLETITVESAKESFLKNISQHNFSGHTTPVIFPGSRFKGYMRGLGYGEVNDVISSIGTSDAELINKKLSIIYNALSNTNIPKFETFDDFIDNFAYCDIDMGLYGLACSTFPERSDIDLMCKSENCGKTHTSNYAMRNLIQFDKFGDMALKAMDEVIEAKSLVDANNVYQSSPVHKHKRVRLPVSKYLVDFGIASARQYRDDICSRIYNTSEASEVERYKKEHPEDPTFNRVTFGAFLFVVRAIHIPNDSNDKYVKFNDPADVLQILFELPISDINLIIRYVDNIVQAYTSVFGIKDDVCPSCGHKIELLYVQLEDLLFYRVRDQMSTELDLDETLYL